MQSPKKIAAASLLMLLLGSSAALAQAYGYAPYQQTIGQNGPTPGCGPTYVLAHNWIIDPATGQAITEPDYQARYPWTNISTWTYNCQNGLWTDNTAQQAPSPVYQAPVPVYPSPSHYQGPAYYQGRRAQETRGDHRESRNDNHDRGHDQNRGNGHDKGHGKG